MKRVVAIGVIGALAVSACGSDAKKSTKPKAAVRASTTTTAKPPPVAPLTGLPDPTGIAQSRSLVSIKIDNDSNLARPQTGLEQADVVWDEVVEGEGTRFLAMYQSQTPDVVGPVRSVRRTDPLIVWPLGGIFAYSGGAKYAVDAISQAPVKLVDESAAGDAMFRDSSRQPPHNLYARPEKLFTLGGQPAPPPALFTYTTAPITDGPAVLSVRIAFGNQEFAPTYTWEAGSATWLRSTRDGPFLAKSGAQIGPKNVIVLPIVYAGGVGQIGAEGQLVGQGAVKVFTNGHEIDGTWTRPDKAQRIELKDGGGKPIALTPGTTWVELPDVGYAIEVAPAAPASAPSAAAKP